MLPSLPAPARRILIIGLVMAASYIAFATIIEGAKKDASSGDTLSEINSATISAHQAKLNFAGAVITLPAPAGYCFLEQAQEVDAIALGLVEQAQKRYGNHLWTVFVRCDDLETMRRTKNLNAYTNTGVIVTPEQFVKTPVKAEVFAEETAKQVALYGSEEVKTAVNDARRSANKPEELIKSTQPEIYHNKDGAMMFTLEHTMPTTSGDIITTEFDIMTAIKDRAIVVIFKAGKLDDTAEMKQATKDYLAALRAAN